MDRRIIQVEERVPLLQTFPLSLQHLMAMFGATVLVPFLLKVDPATALLMNGVGTLIYLMVTKGRIPAYLGSSFAFISPVMAVMARPELGGYGAAQAGFIVFGLFFMLVSLVVNRVGTRWIEVAFPPAAMGAVVAVIGLELAPVALDMAGFGDALPAGVASRHTALMLSMVTLALTVAVSAFGRGFLAIVPILVGVVGGFVLGAVLGVVDFKAIGGAPWMKLPHLYAPKFSVQGILLVLPACLVVLAEHVGHLVVTGEIVGRDLVKNPGLDRSLFGDGLSNVLSGLVGSTPNTTYGENIGVMALTGVFSTWVIAWAAVMAILLSCIGKIAAVIHAIPVPVMGGVCILLFGVIAVAGIRMLVEGKVDYTQPRNLVLTAVILSVGVSGKALKVGPFEMKGMALAAVIGVLLSLTFHVADVLKTRKA